MEGLTLDRGATSALAADWRQSGLRPGDMVLVHSSIARTLRRLRRSGAPPDPRIVLDSLLEAIGPEGTLLLPLFNFDFCDGAPFDIRSTPSQMGALTEAARASDGAVRTGHPIYSFAVLGRRRGLFEGLENFSGYGADSPFGVLHRDGGKIAVLDLPDQQSMTFYHYVEESRGAPHRFHKRFTGDYTDASGKTKERTFGLFVRDTDKGVLTAVDPMSELLWEQGLYSGCRPRTGSGLRVISAPAMFDAVAEMIDAGRARGLLYEIQSAAAR